MNDKQAAFCREYVKDFNATQAAIRAGYSVKTAGAIGSENLTKPEIKQAIDERIMSADEAASIITDIARGDIADLLAVSTQGFTVELLIDDPDNKGQKIINPKTRLIKSIDQTVTTILSKKDDGDDKEIIRTKIELYSKHDAARDILKYRGKLIDKSEVKMDVTEEVVTIYLPDNGRPNNGNQTPEG
jgi:phage terminase small subunit